MRAEWIKKIAVSAVLLFSFSPAAFAHCLEYGAEETLEGTLEQRSYAEQPNYENMEKSDVKATYWIVHLKTPVCFEGSNDVDVAEEHIDEMQLMFPQEPVEKWSPGADVRVKGTFFHAVTGHHHTTILIKVAKITPGVKW